MFRRYFGLTAFQIKVIGLLFMTLCYIAINITIINERCSDVIKICGKISAPLFLYMVTESMHHTRSKKRHILRLYLGAVFTGAVHFFMMLFFGDFLNYRISNNIMYSFFYTALYIKLIEYIVIKLREKKYIKIFIPIAVILITLIVPYIILVNNQWWTPNSFPDNSENVIILNSFVEIFVSSPVFVMFGRYSLLFILMGILIYFVPGKEQKLLVFVIFCIISCIGSNTYFWEGSRFPSGIFSPNQYFMLLAYPFMYLYNGERGKSFKWFFYLYYPLHQYLIAIVAIVITF